MTITTLSRHEISGTSFSCSVCPSAQKFALEGVLLPASTHRHVSSGAGLLPASTRRRVTLRLSLLPASPHRHTTLRLSLLPTLQRRHQTLGLRLLPASQRRHATLKLSLLPASQRRPAAQDLVPPPTTSNGIHSAKTRESMPAVQDFATHRLIWHPLYPSYLPPTDTVSCRRSHATPQTCAVCTLEEFQSLSAVSAERQKRAVRNSRQALVMSAVAFHSSPINLEENTWKTAPRSCGMCAWCRLLHADHGHTALN